MRLGERIGLARARRRPCSCAALSRCLASSSASNAPTWIDPAAARRWRAGVGGLDVAAARWRTGRSRCRAAATAARQHAEDAGAGALRRRRSERSRLGFGRRHGDAVRAWPVWTGAGLRQASARATGDGARSSAAAELDHHGLDRDRLDRLGRAAARSGAGSGGLLLEPARSARTAQLRRRLRRDGTAATGAGAACASAISRSRCARPRPSMMWPSISARIRASRAPPVRAAEHDGDDVAIAALHRGDEVEAGRAGVAGLDAVDALRRGRAAGCGCASRWPR